ncbi:Pentatricopeptide repeat-containing protein, mitochondrial [Sesamum alatum]|uniref:Pentatricopeptide repeat-containing protein, mitochondrial n=1 Tax=Sesamum alatum TaxID=300844 RepID=A0AAE1YW28_9LAMI|nr:Pentatricopeptide repeat-containing protein, mitochondrial [Sesamum alatum]
MNKVSSSLCRRLRTLFLHKPTSATAVETSTGEKSIQKLVNQFKEKSNSSHFRGQRLVYKTTVRRLAKGGHFSSIHEILDQQKLFPDIKDEHFTARLICLYGQAKMLDHALQLFDQMPELNCPRTVLSFNALMAACFPSKSFSKVIEIFQELPGKLSVKPNVISYTSVIRAFCEMGSLDAAMSMLDDMEKNDVVPNAVTFDTLLGAFYSSGRFSEAEKLWSLMEEKKVIPDLRCYNSRLHGMVKENRLSEAMDVFKELEEKGLKPNNYTYNLVIKGFVNEGNLDEVKKWYAAMVESGCGPDFVTFMTLIPFGCDNNDIDFAYESCKKSAGLKIKLPRGIIQKVIDELIEQSKVDKAKELLKLGRSKSGLVLDKQSLSAGD